MNFDICNKCKYKTNKYFLDLISENQYKFLGVYKHDTDYYCQLPTNFDKIKLKSTMSFNSIKKIFKDKVKPDKSCPYYVQHQLTEWSKEK